MTEEGTLSIVRRGTFYQVRYASNNVHDRERLPRVCPDEARLAALLRHCGTESAVIAQVCADVRHGKMAVLLVVVSAQNDCLSSCRLNKQRLINSLEAEVNESARLIESTGVSPPYKISRFHRESLSSKTGSVCGKKASAIWSWNSAVPCTTSGCA
jgi:hypothetical protein